MGAGRATSPGPGIAWWARSVMGYTSTGSASPGRPRPEGSLWCDRRRRMPTDVELTAVRTAGGGVRWLATLDPIMQRRYRDAVRPSVAGSNGCSVRASSATALARAGGCAPSARRETDGTTGSPSSRRSVEPCSGAMSKRATRPSRPAWSRTPSHERGSGHPSCARSRTSWRDSSEPGCAASRSGRNPRRSSPTRSWPRPDLAARRAGGTIVRWVDDVVFAGPDRTTVQRSFDAWAVSLASLGLRPHDGKTVLDPPRRCPTRSR